MTNAPHSRIRTDIPHSARIWNFWMGGEDYYEVDRLAGEAGLDAYPEIRTMAVQSRRFLIRAVRYLAAEAGIRQFLDIGTGLPTMQNTHEVAQGIAPESRIVYVDNDPMVLAHARALLTSTSAEGVTTYLEADFNNPEDILAGARHVLNFNKPIAIMFIGVLGHARTYQHMRRIIDTCMDAVPSGSYLALYDGTVDDPGYVTLCENYARTGGVPYNPRTPEEILGCFEGLELVPPGVTPIDRWRVDDPEHKHTSAHGGVARKP
ncbi:SAM-dependent methyltransferase [Nocardia uniformis]|uniref:SAM-dependent methyltransferase n=1 Tax=Nocardia uniformis TaxID=53432 RepID=A0A849BVV7_9NOCA|nr:SAM-dependent methyltransferase [Nocardia uniformis]NNH70692.1 SAM-dependent methyltransferase [Nocardia uniformis]